MTMSLNRELIYHYYFVLVIREINSYIVISGQWQLSNLIVNNYDISRTCCSHGASMIFKNTKIWQNDRIYTTCLSCRIKWIILMICRNIDTDITRNRNLDFDKDDTATRCLDISIEQFLQFYCATGTHLFQSFLSITPQKHNRFDEIKYRIFLYLQLVNYSKINFSAQKPYNLKWFIVINCLFGDSSFIKSHCKSIFLNHFVSGVETLHVPKLTK